MVVRTLTGVNGDSYTSRYFGSGDGSRVLFNLAGMGADRAYLMPVLFKQDWGGIQQLYSTARTNLLLYSQDVSNVVWQKYFTTIASTAIAPDGTTTALGVYETIDNGYHEVLQPRSPLTSGVYTFSVYLKANGRTFVKLAQTGADGAIFNLASGIVQSVSTGYTASITDVGNGWYRCVLTTNSAVTLCTCDVFPGLDATTFVYPGDVTKGIFYWGAQLELGDTATLYIPTTAAPVTVTDYSVDATGKVTNSPALPSGTIISYQDPHAPSGNVYRAFGVGDGTSTDFSLPFVPKVPVLYQRDWQGNQLLYPTPRTNYLIWSEDFTKPHYTLSNATLTGSVLDPRGSTNAFTLTATLADGTMIPGVVTGAQTVTNSVWARRRTGTGLVGLLDPAYSFWTLLTLTTEWQRFQVSGVSAGTGYWGIRVYTAGDAVDLAFGQIEPGSSVTPYIPTTTAPVTVTDYTYTPNGDVTMAVAPVVGAILTGDFNMGPTP
ncbi:MAG: hypothetical protein KGN80_00055 [Acidobacteriota bacterium]|nr:hypothetical protein [Acidobacteriota bacterium]